MKRIRNAYTKAVGKDWYKKMLAAKQAKADKAKRDKNSFMDEQSKSRPENLDKNKTEPISPTSDTKATSSTMEEKTSSNVAIERALNRIREQAKGI